MKVLNAVAELLKRVGGEFLTLLCRRPAPPLRVARRRLSQIEFWRGTGIAGHILEDFMFPPDAPPIARLLQADYAKMSEMVGGHTERVERPAEIRPALERALAAAGPALVHVLVDPKAMRSRGMNFLE